MHVPVYATVSDANVTRTTSSRRGKITSINFDANTHFGRAIDVQVYSEGRLLRKDEREAEKKIELWKSKGNQKRVEEWTKKLQHRKVFNFIQEQNEEVKVFVNPNIDNPKVKCYIGGVRLTPEDLKLIHENSELLREQLNKLKIAKSLDESNEIGGEQSYY